MIRSVAKQPLEFGISVRMDSLGRKNTFSLMGCLCHVSVGRKDPVKRFTYSTERPGRKVVYAKREFWSLCAVIEAAELGRSGRR